MSVNTAETLKSPKALLKGLLEDLTALLSKHVELYKLEVKEEAKFSMMATLSVIIGALVGYTSLTFIGLFFIFLLSEFFSMWFSSLVVAIVFLVISGSTFYFAKKYLGEIKKGNDSVLDQTMKTMESAKKWLLKLK